MEKALVSENVGLYWSKVTIMQILKELTLTESEENGKMKVFQVWKYVNYLISPLNKCENQK